MIFLCMVWWAALSVPMLFLRQILAIFGTQEEVADYAVSFIRIVYPVYIMELVTLSYINYCVAQ